MSESRFHKKTIGILGAGQLAKMLAESAKPLGIKTVVYGNNKLEPASYSADQLIVRPTQKEEDLQEFFQQVDLVIFENEFFDPSFEESVAKFINLDCQPKPSVMTKFANKLNQKKMLNELNIPTTKFSILGQDETPKDWLESLKKEFPNKSVIKWAHGGYDGKGNMVFNGSESDEESERLAIEFINHAIDRKVEVYAEQFTPFKCELALITVRSVSGDFRHYPMVMTKQVDGICFEVKGPAVKWGVSDELERVAQDSAKKLAEQFDLFGVFAIEFFLTQDGNLLVNEIAPRVHNSGHYSQEGAPVSQFENHLRAVLGMELGQTMLKDQFFAMVNILGPKAFSGEVSPPKISIEKAWLHWYEKKEGRPGRKLGHVNIISDDKQQLEDKLKLVTQAIEDWQMTYTKKGNL